MVLLTERLPGIGSLSTHDQDHNHEYNYDVFLSFRGADTRNSFTDHLYNTLLDAGFITFLDDEEIETGEQLKPELESAIKSSRASIIVLSKNYASSTWCLDELALILDQKTNFNQIVIPIFYHVEPTNVRKQTSTFGEALAEHTRRMEGESNEEKRSQLAQKMESWKRALTHVADLKGKDAKGRKESGLIEEVVNDIHRRLGVLLCSTLPLLIGMGHYIKFISSWLTDGSSHTADILTVVGISGIGKTSLAKYVFQLHSCKFQKTSFIESINARCIDRFNGLLDLQKQLLGDICKNNPLQVNDVFVYTSKIENVLGRKRAFVVLDDIGGLDQLDALLGNKGLHPGSKIIITTKDASLTERCALFNPQVQPKHEKVSLNGLCESESLQLLCIHAFKNHNPKEGYKEVSEKLVKYCQGHPLALEVLGKSLHKRDVAHWEDCIKGLKKEPHSGITKALQMSFDSLPSVNDKELFKHVACFFVGKDRDLTETMLIACDLNTRSGMTILIDRCLLSIGWNNKLTMHQLVQEMGRDLVRQESPEKPWKRSRLWCHEESFKVLKHKKGKGNLLGLALDMRLLDKKKLCGSFVLKTDSFSQMHNLMLLQLNYVQLNESFENFPEELRWLCMHGSPLKSIPLDLPMHNLVSLDMSYSTIEYFDMSCINPQPPPKRQKLVGSCSKDNRLLGSLKILDLSFCEQLHSLGGFFELPALERLIVKNCISLIKVCESVEQCVELLHIDMSYCYKLQKLPTSMEKLKKVKSLLLDGCNSRESQIETIPRYLKLIVFSLPRSLTILSLANNNLSNASFPVDFSCLSMLKELCLDNNPIVSMPNCLRTLPRLERLGMNSCKMMISVEHPPRTLKLLSIKTRSLLVHDAPSKKIKFHPEMCELILEENWKSWSYVSHSSLEIDGMVKIQPIAGVEEKVLHSLGWTNLKVIKERRLRIYHINESIQTKMYYEFGIFSMFYCGDEIPNGISCRKKGSSISFSVPSSPKKLRGLNLCCTMQTDLYDSLNFPMIKISNITKNQTWIYCHYIDFVEFGGFCYVSLLSHWMFGPNEMECGDKITIVVYYDESRYDEQFTIECGIGLVYDEDGNTEGEEEDDALDYYKSWNRIIGGDLSAFQLTTGEYVLDNFRYINYPRRTGSLYFYHTDGNVRYKGRYRFY